MRKQKCSRLVSDKTTRWSLSMLMLLLYVFIIYQMNVKRKNLLVYYDLVSCGEDNRKKNKTLSDLICPHLVLLSIAALCSAVPHLL